VVLNMLIRFKNEGFLNCRTKFDDQCSSKIYFSDETCLVLQYNIERLDDARRVPPFGWFDLLRHSGGRSPAFRLYLANGPEAPSRKCFLEFTRIDMSVIEPND